MSIIGSIYNGTVSIVAATPVGLPISSVQQITDLLPKSANRVSFTFRNPTPSTGPVIGYKIRYVDLTTSSAHFTTYFANETV